MGWREWVSFPEFAVEKVKAKVDTGARTSALHAENIFVFEENGVQKVKFVIRPKQKNRKKKVIITATLLSERLVRSSTGYASYRPVILTNITIGNDTWPVEITLVNRDIMGFRMLLGRNAVKKRYLIDPGRSFLLSKSIRKTPE